MNNLFIYLLELNVALMILFVAYKLFFERDSNFLVRRIYLLGVVILPLLLPLLPDSVQVPVGNIAPLSLQLEGVTIVGEGAESQASTPLLVGRVAMIIYLLVLGLGILKLIHQMARITIAALSSHRREVNGTSLLENRGLHASSFFGYIFIDPDTIKDNNFNHILEHESTHKKEWHSIDRILTELFVMINWFNPVAWLFRKAVIQNLEYLADSAVLRKGTDPLKYQISILNQYLGSASITNQFSSQIKKRISMLNKNYKLGSRWKLALLLPITAIALLFVSCTEKEGAKGDNLAPEVEAIAESEIFYQVDEMPTFNGGEPIEFRKHIAYNLKYPKEAAENGVGGKIFIRFIVDKEGKVVIPDQETVAKMEGKPIEEVVVVTYRTLEKDAETPDAKYIQMLKDEAVRVVSTSPDWTPGIVKGKNVNVMFTFPISFVLQ
ncbi:MAG: M56 family metallopeptidase [Bacteroides sp.]|nr:M56 family metallopeptidase [Bacteroides sp.]